MEISKKLNNDILKAQEIVQILIDNSRAQKATNFDILFILQRSLADIPDIIKHGSNEVFLKQWGYIIAWAPRVFEGHPLLELLNKIDKQLDEKLT